MNLVSRFVLFLVRSKFTILSAISKKKAAQAAFDLFCTPPSRHTGAVVAPFTEAEQLTAAFREYSIRGFRWNKGGKRRVLIMHGFQSSVLNFGMYIQPLISQGYEVLAFDAPAHGGSSGKRINALVFRDFILFLQNSYGPFNAYIVHSFGGLGVSLALEQEPPPRPARLVLLAPATETQTAVNQFFSLLHLRQQKVRRLFDDIILNLGGHPVQWFSIARIVPALSMPVLWIHDKADTITPFADVQPVIDQSPAHVRFVITEGLGHRRIYREPSTVNEVITFLAE